MMNNSNLSRSYKDHETEFFDYFADLFNPDLSFNLQVKLTVAGVTYILTFLICVAGIVGNGAVIWLLGFRLKRNPSTTYILNLAAADIGILINSLLLYIAGIVVIVFKAFPPLGFEIYANIVSFMYITDQLLLTAISIDRCVAVLFPIWHRCHRPPHLSGIVCTLLWVLSFLIHGLDFLLILANEFMLLRFVVNVAICTPLMTVSTAILFVKICTKSQQRKRGKLLMVISLALFFFLIFGIPMNYCYVVFYYDISNSRGVEAWVGSSSELNSTELNSIVTSRHLSSWDMTIIPIAAAFASSVLNCSINPLIYFLVGRKKKGRARLSMKLALQRVFKGEENCRGQDGPVAETQF